MIPLSVGELTVNQFHSFIKSVKTGNNLEIISSISDYSVSDLESLPLKKLELLNHRLGFLLSDFNDFVEIGRAHV